MAEILFCDRVISRTILGFAVFATKKFFVAKTAKPKIVREITRSQNGNFRFFCRKNRKT